MLYILYLFGTVFAAVIHLLQKRFSADMEPLFPLMENVSLADSRM